MRGPILASSLGLVCALFASACSSTDPQQMIATVSVEFFDSIRGTSWTSCSSQGACRFNGNGSNEGPACARSITGVVWFFDKDQKTITLNIQTSPSGTQFGWLQNPKVDALVRPNEPFKYQSTIAIPASVVTAAVTYASQVSNADVVGSC
jgi:hypothetical protein